MQSSTAPVSTSGISSSFHLGLGKNASLKNPRKPIWMTNLPCCERHIGFREAPESFFRDKPRLDLDLASSAVEGKNARVTVTMRGLFLERSLEVQHGREL